MSTSKERIRQAINHLPSEKIPVDFGSTAVSGIHCKIVAELRDYYGLEKRPVRILDSFQMLGEVDEELKAVMGIDTEGVFGPKDMFGLNGRELHEQVTPWGQPVLIAKQIDLTTDKNGDVYIYPQGDHSVEPSAVMPQKCYFINAIERAEPVDDSNLHVEDNLEEYGYLSEEDLNHFATRAEKSAATGRAVVASFGSAALGDIAFIPGPGLKHPKGIRTVAEWYMSTAMRQDYIHEMFDKQIDIAIANYEKLWNRIGDKVDVVFTCGTDFGTQESQFCSPATFRNLWLPHYKRMNDWIHQHTTWKVMKHCCGAIIPLLPGLIDAGFDIMNPIQINAKGMDSRRLKAEFGRDLVFWGGGIDTQKVLPYGTPEEVREHVLGQCEIFGEGGGFVFNSIHNIQANVPVQNVVAMIEAVKSFGNEKM